MFMFWFIWEDVCFVSRTFTYIQLMFGYAQNEVALNVPESRSVVEEIPLELALNFIISEVEVILNNMDNLTPPETEHTKSSLMSKLQDMKLKVFSKCCLESSKFQTF